MSELPQTDDHDHNRIRMPVVSIHDKKAALFPFMWETAWMEWWWLLCNGVPVWLVPSKGEIVIDRQRTYIEVKLYDSLKSSPGWRLEHPIRPGIDDDYLEYGRIIKYEPAPIDSDRSASYVIVRYEMYLKMTDFGEYPIAPYVAKEARDGS